MHSSATWAEAMASGSSRNPTAMKARISLEETKDFMVSLVKRF